MIQFQRHDAPPTAVHIASFQKNHGVCWVSFAGWVHVSWSSLPSADMHGATTRVPLAGCRERFAQRLLRRFVQLRPAVAISPPSVPESPTCPHAGHSPDGSRDPPVALGRGLGTKEAMATSQRVRCASAPNHVRPCCVDTPPLLEAI